MICSLPDSDAVITRRSTDNGDMSGDWLIRQDKKGREYYGVSEDEKHRHANTSHARARIENEQGCGRWFCFQLFSLHLSSIFEKSAVTRNYSHDMFIYIYITNNK